MKIRYSVLTIALAALTLLAAGPAEASCGKSKRVSIFDVGCITGWWKNSSISTHGAVQQSCHGILGTVKIKVDFKGLYDSTIWLNNNSERTYADVGKTRSLSCCHDYGPCDKREVEPTAQGKNIRAARIGDYYGTKNTWKYVGTCTAAGKLCETGDNASKLYYCKKTWPKRIKDWCGWKSCGDHYCDVGDCKWSWGRSDASEHCTAEDGGIAYAGHHGCTISAQCKTDPDGDATVRATAEAKVWDVNDLVNCAGTLQDKDAECTHVVGSVTAETCENAFEESDATGECAFDEATADLSDVANPLCSIVADCRDDSDPPAFVESSIDVSLEAASGLSNCAGTLTSGSC